MQNGLANIFGHSDDLKVDKIFKVEALWKNFYIIYKEIIAPGGADHVSIRIKTSKWFKDLQEIYISPRITPYIHSFVDHVWEAIQLNKDIHLFNEEGI
jgi:hypothetical protein